MKIPKRARLKWTSSSRGTLLAWADTQEVLFTIHSNEDSGVMARALEKGSGKKTETFLSTIEEARSHLQTASDELRTTSCPEPRKVYGRRFRGSGVSKRPQRELVEA